MGIARMLDQGGGLIFDNFTDNMDRSTAKKVAKGVSLYIKRHNLRGMVLVSRHCDFVDELAPMLSWAFDVERKRAVRNPTSADFRFYQSIAPERPTDVVVVFDKENDRDAERDKGQSSKNGKDEVGDDEDEDLDCTSCCSVNVLFFVAISVTSLAEDYAALFLKSDDFPESTIFWMFFAFAFFPALCCWSDNFWFGLSMEVVQAVLFFIISVSPQSGDVEFGSTAMFVFAGFLAFQAIAMTIPAVCGRCSDDDEDQSIQNEEHNAGLRGCVSLFINGVFFMPFIYYREESPFRQQYFDIALTFMIWIGDFLESFGARAANVKGCGKNQRCFRAFGVLKLSLTLIKFVFVGALCLIYFGDDSPEAWEEAWALIFLVMAVLIFLVLVWSIKSYLCDSYIWATKDEDTSADQMLSNSACLRCCIPKSWQDILLASDLASGNTGSENAPEFGRGHKELQQRRQCDEDFNAEMENWGKAQQGQGTEMVPVRSVSEVELEVGKMGTANTAQSKHLESLQMEASTV